MKVLIDTNIILDVLCKRPGFYEDSAKIFKLCESACAARVKANYIITRNIKDFTESRAAAVKPAQFLERI